jgi:hypothetical protein
MARESPHSTQGPLHYRNCPHKNCPLRRSGQKTVWRHLGPAISPEQPSVGVVTHKRSQATSPRQVSPGLRNLGRPWGRLTARWLIHRIKVQQSASYQNRCRSCCRKRSLKELSGLSFATRNNLHQAKRRAILRATVHVHWVPHVTGEQGFGTAQTRKLFSKAPPPQLVRRPPTISRVKAQPGVRE